MESFGKIEKMFSEIKIKLAEMDVKLENNSKEMKRILMENQCMKTVIKEQDERIDVLEKEIKRRNIIIKGIVDGEEESEVELKDKVMEVMNKMGVKLKINEDIDEMKRIGKFAKNSNRPIIVKMLRIKTKIEVLKATKNLAGTKIWIEDDFTRRIQNERKRLIPHLKKARIEGEKAQLKYNTLVINGKRYKIEDFPKEEEELVQKYEEKTKLARTMSERSPEHDQMQERMTKMTRTVEQKN